MEHIRTAMQKYGTNHGAWIVGADALGARPVRDTLWENLPLAGIDPVHLAAGRIVTVGRTDPALGAFDMMRTRILHQMQENKWSSIAITSPKSGAGKSLLALNLAFSLANLENCRTVLMDLDLREPSIAAALAILKPPAIEDYLRGRTARGQAFRRLRPNFAVAPNGKPVSLASELLQSPETARVFREMKQALRPDIILCDLPPMLASDDLTAFLPNVDCVILVVEAETDTLQEVDGCEHELATRSNVLGVVLNKCRHRGEATAYGNGN